MLWKRKARTMVTPDARKTILEYLDLMSPEQQRQMIDYARQLVEAPPPSISGQALLDSIGPVPKDELDRVESAIEQGCERIDHERW